jgi:hypothetical protein
LSLRLCHFFLDKKVTKKSSQQRGFFSLLAFSLQIKQNLVRKSFALLRLTFQRFSKTCFPPCYRTCPALFCLLSPEAYLLTE